MYHVAVVCENPKIFEKLLECARTFFGNLITIHGPYPDIESVEGDGACIEMSAATDSFHESTGEIEQVLISPNLPGDAGRSLALPGDTPPVRIFAALIAMLEDFEVRDRPGDVEIVEELTPREIEVLQLISGGYSNREIAGYLDITERTVKYHVSEILRKLQVTGRTEAVVEAARYGIVKL